MSIPNEFMDAGVRTSSRGKIQRRCGAWSLTRKRIRLLGCVEKKDRERLASSALRVNSGHRKPAREIP